MAQNIVRQAYLLMHVANAFHLVFLFAAVGVLFQMLGYSAILPMRLNITVLLVSAGIHFFLQLRARNLYKAVKNPMFENFVSKAAYYAGNLIIAASVIFLTKDFKVEYFVLTGLLLEISAFIMSLFNKPSPDDLDYREEDENLLDDIDIT